MKRPSWTYSQFWLDRLAPPKGILLVTLAILVGVVTAFGGIALIWLLSEIHSFVDFISKKWGLVGILTAMALSGVVVGFIVDRWAKEAKGHGVPEVMEALALRGGVIRPVVALAKIVASALTIGFGGSAGREGPIVQIGSAFGSSLGQMLHLSEKRIRILVACGAAAGIAATFNAPIAGTIFALEVILASFTVRYFGVVVISSVSGSIVSRLILGPKPAFSVPLYSFHHIGEIPIYIFLAVCAAFLGVLFIIVLYAFEDFFDKIPLHQSIVSGLGMFLTGFFAYFLARPEVLGSGLHFIGEAISENFHLTIGTLAVLLVLKLLVTSFTLGSGNSGGIFAPSLFMGAVLGGMIGTLANKLWPEVAVNPGAYAIVGMAATFTAAARAPMTAILIVFEMSKDYQLILPLMLATVIAHFLAEAIFKESIYTLKLAKKGIYLQEGRDLGILHGVTVEEIMVRDFHVVSEDTTLSELSDIFAHTHWHAIMVVDRQGKLSGIVAISDLDRAINKKLPPDTPVSQIMTPYERVQVVFPDETMGDALHRMGIRGFSVLPVVTREDPRKLVGVIRRGEIISAYNMALARRAEIQHRTRYAKLENNSEGMRFVEFTLNENDRAVGLSLQQIAPKMPRDCILVSIHRDGRVLIPHGNTIFQKGDRITAFIRNEDVEKLFGCLKGNEKNGD